MLYFSTSIWCQIVESVLPTPPKKRPNLKIKRKLTHHIEYINEINDLINNWLLIRNKYNHCKNGNLHVFQVHVMFLRIGHMFFYNKFLINSKILIL